GLKKAANKYVVFMDADDTLTNDALEKLAQAIERGGEPDLLATRFKSGYEKNGELILTDEKCNMNETDGIISGSELLAKINLERRQLACNNCIGVYKRTFMLDHQLWQNETLSLYEDNEWMPRVVFHAETVAACDYAYYNYIRSGGSITTSLTLDSLKSVAAAAALMTNFFAQNKAMMPSAVRSFWGTHTFNALFWYFFNPLYTQKFTRRQWLEAWNSTSPVVDDELRPVMAEMLPYISRAKRLAWPLLGLISDSGLIFPAKLYFRILYLARRVTR
ncbi:MAG: glycosyltransferase, partial [Victivallaceae bacterium]